MRRDDQEGFARTALREVRVADHLLSPSELLHQIGRWKSQSITPKRAVRIAQTDKEHLASVAFRRYQESLKQAGGVDFDDLLCLTEQLFREFPECRKQEAGCWNHLLIDEYQDTNGLQYEIVRELARQHRNLCVVGDDDQSIYGWRGAEVRHILNFKKDWPEAVVVRLEQNYRSTGEILGLANRLIAFNRFRHPKQLTATQGAGRIPGLLQLEDEQKEAAEVVRQIRNLLQTPGVLANEIAILFRTNEQPRAFETELRRHRVPYVLIGSQSFFDRKEIKDVLSFLRLVVRPEDDLALRRIINIPPRGIGKSTFTQLSERSLQQGRPIWELMQQGVQQGAGDFSPAAQRGVEQLTGAINRAQTAMRSGGNLVDLATQLLADVRYRAEIERAYSDTDDRESRWASIEQLVNRAGAIRGRAARPSRLG